VTDWRDRVDRLLYDGERVVESVAVTDDRVVVTTHRVLALTPNAEGANFRAVDLPNVEGVEISTGGTGRYLRWTIRPLVLGAILVVAGTQLDLGDPLSGMDTSSAEATGTGDILSTVSSLTSLLAVLDEVMLAIGGVCLLVVALLLGLYLHSRETALVIGVAGDDDLRLPADAGDESVVGRLETAIAGATAPDESPETPISGVLGESDADAGSLGSDGADSPGDDDFSAATDDAPTDEPRTVEDVLGAAGSDRDAADANVPSDPPPADDEPK